MIFPTTPRFLCSYAIYLAKLTGKDIILFHSFFDQIYFSDGGFATGFESGIMLTDEIILDFYRKKEIRLNEIAKEMMDSLITQGSPAVSVTCQMESGNPEVQIPECHIQDGAGYDRYGLKRDG